VLIDAIWGDRPPDTAVKALQVHISQLRKVLAAPVIETRPPGYLLRIEDDRLDVAHFERLRGVAATTPAPRDRARLLTEALALWRGPALADVEPPDALRGELARLETLRLHTLESRVAADLACGRHVEVVPELQTLIARHPLRERLRADLMLALYRSGRQAEALSLFGDTRARLVAELGVEPGRELRDLHARILAQDPALDLPVDPRTAGLIGREREMALLRAVVDGALAGRGVVVLLSGEPGIGKSTIAEAVTAYAAAQGAVAALGQCWEAGGAPTYGPWVPAIRTVAEELGPALLQDSALTGLLPELADESARHRDDGSRFQLFAAVSRLLRRVAAARPLVLWLDDLHAADAGSIELLRYLVGDLVRSPIVVIGTYRDTEDGHAAALAELARAPAVRRVPLGGLSADGTTRLLEGTAGVPVSSDLVARIVARTEGNPLFTVEIARLVAVSGRDGQILPGKILDVIGQRVGHRSAACRETLVLASVIGREFDVDALVDISPLEEDDVFASLDEAVAAGLVGEVPQAPGRLRFSHMMVRDALYDGITPHRRLRLHRHVADGFEAVYGTGAGPHVAELAHHYVAAGRRSADKAVDYSVLTGDRAASQFAYEEAAVHYSTALEVLRTAYATDERRACELLVRLGEARSRAGDTVAAKPPLRAAAASAHVAGWSDLLARAALAYGGRLAWARGCTDPALIPLLQDALNALHHGTDAASAHARARLLGRLAAARRDDRSGTSASRWPARRWASPRTSTTRPPRPSRQRATSSPPRDRTESRSSSSSPTASSRWPDGPVTRRSSTQGINTASPLL
jgi:DNA-binding SARP family transcriptional activator